MQNLFARGNAVVIEVHREASANSVETACILFARKPRHSCRAPFGTHIVGRSKRCAVVDDRASSETLSSQQPYTLIRSRGKSTLQIQPLEPAKLPAIEVSIVVVAARLDHDNVLARRSQHCSSYAPARTRADDANIARQIRIHFRS